jgi:hypothetical protein
MVGEVVGVEALDKKELWRILQRNERRGGGIHSKKKKKFDVFCAPLLCCLIDTHTHTASYHLNSVKSVCTWTSRELGGSSAFQPQLLLPRGGRNSVEHKRPERQ